MNELNKRKIIFVSPYFKPQTGGLENYVSNIAKGLNDLGWETIVVTSNQNGEKYREEFIEGTKVYRLPILFKISNTPINPLWFFYLRKIFKKENPDLINAHAPVPFMADMAVLTTGKHPFILTYHYGSMKKRKFFFDLIIWIYEHSFFKITASRAERIICPSNFVISDVLEKYQNKALVITPGVDLRLFKPDAGTFSDKDTVLFIARYANMFKMKGLFTLLEAAKELPELTFKIIGEEIKVDLRNVVFLGVKSVADTVLEMQKCTLLVLPSLAHADSFGMVLIEAMACGKPVIGTKTGGIPEIICDGKDGLLVPPDEPKLLVDAIRRIVSDLAYADFLAKNGLLKIQTKYSWPIKIQETKNLFEKILIEKNNSR